MALGYVTTPSPEGESFYGLTEAVLSHSDFKNVERGIKITVTRLTTASTAIGSLRERHLLPVAALVTVLTRVRRIYFDQTTTGPFCLVRQTIKELCPRRIQNPPFSRGRTVHCWPNYSRRHSSLVTARQRAHAVAVYVTTVYVSSMFSFTFSLLGCSLEIQPGQLLSFLSHRFRIRFLGVLPFAGRSRLRYAAHIHCISSGCICAAFLLAAWNV